MNIKDFPKDVVLTVVGVIIGSFLVFILLSKCNKKEEIKTITNIVKIKADSTDYWKDQYGREHAEKVSATGTLAELKVAYGTEISAKAKELSIRDKQIKSMLGFNLTRKINLDSLMATLPKDTTYRHDTGYITIKTPQYINFFDSISVTNYDKKYGFLNLQKKPYVDVITYDNGGKIGMIQGFEVNQKDPIVKLRPVASIIYQRDGTLVPAAGIGAEIKLGPIPIIISVQKSF